MLKLAAGRALLDAAWRFRQMLAATGILELKQRYAGSALGSAWILLYPAIFLSIYLILYLVIFEVRFPGMTSLGFVVFVFSGLVPYLVIIEAVTRGAVIVKENMHLIKNVIMPVELVPLRLVMVSLMAQTASFLVLIALSLIDGSLGWRVLFLPPILLLVSIYVLGFVYYVACLGVIFNDVAYIVNLAMVALMFLSPIAFKPDMVPTMLQAIVYLNPVSYPLEVIRWSVLSGYDVNLFRALVFPALSVGMFAAGASFFQRFKGLMADNV